MLLYMIDTTDMSHMVLLHCMLLNNTHTLICGIYCDPVCQRQQYIIMRKFSIWFLK